LNSLTKLASFKKILQVIGIYSLHGFH